MDKRKTRGRPSRVEKLPPATKAQLDKDLREGQKTQKQIVEEANQKLTDEQKISRSGINRYATRMESVGAKLRETREIANVWMARFGDDQGSDVLQLVVEMMQSALFKVALKASDDESEEELFDPKMLKDVSLAVQRLSRAAEMNAKREQALRKEIAAQAAASVEQVASAGGMSQTTIDDIKREILGIA